MATVTTRIFFSVAKRSPDGARYTLQFIVTLAPASARYDETISPMRHGRFRLTDDALAAGLYFRAWASFKFHYYR